MFKQNVVLLSQIVSLALMVMSAVEGVGTVPVGSLHATVLMVPVLEAVKTGTLTIAAQHSLVDHIN